MTDEFGEDEADRGLWRFPPFSLSSLMIILADADMCRKSNTGMIPMRNSQPLDEQEPDPGKINRRRRCPVPVEHLPNKLKRNAIILPELPSLKPIPSLIGPQWNLRRTRARKRDLERETMAKGWNERKRVSPEERSRSLPSHRHPTTSKLEWEILAVGDVIRSGAHLRPALTQLERLHHASVNFLLLPSTVETLRLQSSSPLAESLLEDLLSYADAYGSLRIALLCVQDLRLEAQAAVRRRDQSTFCDAASSLRRAQKEIASLVKLLPLAVACKHSGHVAKTLTDVTSATVLVSTRVFNGVSDVVGEGLPKSTSAWQRLWKSTPLRSSPLSIEQAAKASKALKEMEESLTGLEKATENVYKELVNARVSLLNALSPL